MIETMINSMKIMNAESDSDDNNSDDSIWLLYLGKTIVWEIWIYLTITDNNNNNNIGSGVNQGVTESIVRDMRDRDRDRGRDDDRDCDGGYIMIVG